MEALKVLLEKASAEDSSSLDALTKALVRAGYGSGFVRPYAIGSATEPGLACYSCPFGSHGYVYTRRYSGHGCAWRNRDDLIEDLHPRIPGTNLPEGCVLDEHVVLVKKEGT